ncbi:hypothetical protein BN2497_7989 [Janthinobacterium sp. CG23_2]|nr:hypothetical protein BN2497_7989 [Janthinobacterium sp. CG23_2]CUU30392.1 hypothetical protein BN3177_7989 [Janthinobacterium sp. CG23_2]
MPPESTNVIDKLVASAPERDILLISQPISRELHYNLSVLIAKGKKT